MLDIEVSVRATFMMSLLAEVLILIALGAVQTGNGNEPPKTIAYRFNVRKGSISIANGSAMEVGKIIPRAISDVFGQLYSVLRICLRHVGD